MAPPVPLDKLTPLGADPYESLNHFTLIGQKSNGVCYALWGFRSQPANLTANGKKLFAYMVANPICMSSVLYLKGANDPLTSGIMTTVLSKAGFYNLSIAASSAASLDLSGYDLVVAGWDTASAWDTPANVDAIRRSGTPVLGMGRGGENLFLKLGLSPSSTSTIIGPAQSAVNLINPLVPEMLQPNPVIVDSTLFATLDTSPLGVAAWVVSGNSPTLIAKPDANPYITLLTQASKSTCYTFWGFEDYAANMTPLALSLFATWQRPRTVTTLRSYPW